MKNRLHGLDPKEKTKNVLNIDQFNQVFGHTPEECEELVKKEGYPKLHKIANNAHDKVVAFHESVQFLDTVKSNLKHMSQAQREKAKRARRMCQAIGTPTTSDLSAMIRMNLIKDNEVTSEDTVLAEEAHREDIRSCKGKSARSKPKVAISNRITLPKELMNVNCEVTLSIDGMTTNGLQFLT